MIEARCTAAEEALERGDVAEARKLVLGCGSLEGVGNNARYAALCGRIAAFSGDYKAAATHFNRAHQLEPDHGDYTAQLGEALTAQGDMSGAAAVLAEAVRQQPTRHELAVDLAYVLLACGDREGASAALESLAVMSDLSPATILALAECYQALGEESKAIRWFDQLARVAPHPRGLNGLARLCLHVRDFAQGEFAFRTLGRADSASELMSLHGITWCRMQRLRWRDALESAVGAIRVDRSSLTIDFLDHAKNGLFIGNPSDQLGAELGKRLAEEMDNYAAQHCIDPLASPDR
jgi:tetratricopeptide (TPR) repeat protein